MSEPRLRVKGFEGEWGEKKLKELVNYRTSNLTIADAKDEGEFCLYDVNKCVGCINEGGIGKDFVSIVKDGDAGRTRVLPAGSAITSTLGALIPKEEKAADFINGLMQNTSFTSLKAGTAIQHVYFSEYGEVLHLVPEIKEQRAIGETLKAMDEMIENARKELERLKQVKKASLSVMFPQEGETKPRVRFKGFTDDWEQRKLGEVADIVGGGTPSTTKNAYWDGDIDWYAPAEIADQIYVDNSQRKITVEGFNNSSAKMLPVGTVLFTSRAGIGKTAILRKESCTNQGFQSIVPHKNMLDSYFIFSRTEELKRYGESVGAGSTFVEVSGKQMAAMQLMMPPSMDEQIKIGVFFEHLDNLITLHQRELEKLERVKSALLSQTFPSNR